MKKLHHVGFALFFLAACAHANVVGAGGGGIVWSLQCDGYLVKVPDGWILDNKIAAAHGIDMFFLPVAAPRVLDNGMSVYAYVMPTVKNRNAGPLKAELQPSVQGLIDLAAKDYMRADASTKVAVSSTDWGFDSKDRKITLAHISAPALGKYDAIAYDEDSRSIFAVSLTAKSPQLLAENEVLLKQIVASAKVIHTVGVRPPCPVLPTKTD